MRNDVQLASVRRLVADISSQMEVAERQVKSRRHAPGRLPRLGPRAVLAVVAVLLVAGPAAAAVVQGRFPTANYRQLFDSVFAPDPVPTDRATPPSAAPHAAAGSPVFVMQGQVGDLKWGVTARSCDYRGATGAAIALVLSSGAAGANDCGSLPPQLATPGRLQADYFYAGDVDTTWVYGLVPGNVTSVDITVVHAGPPNAVQEPGIPQVVKVPTRPLPDDAKQAGGLPSGFRVFAFVGSGSLRATRVEGPDSAGNRVDAKAFDQ
jgi:hypothetical protein